MSPSGPERVFTSGQIADHVGGALEGPSDVSVRGVAGLEEAGEGDLTFLANPKYRAALATTDASVVLAPPNVECPAGVAVIRTPDPYAALMRSVHLFDPGLPTVAEGIHPSAAVHPDVEINEGVAIGPGCVVEEGVVLGSGTCLTSNVHVGSAAVIGVKCYLYPGVFVARACRLGDRVHVHAGTVIGSDGFGYVPVEGVYHKIPQIGIVEIGDDVELGANVCIDRATLGRTVIGRGTKIDNLVHIAHNVAIGEDCALAGQVGFAGSSRIGSGVRIGGQAGIAGHMSVGDGVSIGAQAGVMTDLTDGETVSGYPARDHRAAMREALAMRKLPKLLRRVRALEAGKESSGACEPPKERGNS